MRVPQRHQHRYRAAWRQNSHSRKQSRKRFGIGYAQRDRWYVRQPRGRLREVPRREPRRRLRKCARIAIYRFPLPALPEFAQRYPEIELDLDFNDRLVDLVEGGFDAAIRSGPLSDSSLMARRLGPFRFVLAAAPAYLARSGVPRKLSQLEAHACVRYRFPTTGKLQPWDLATGREAPGQFSILWPSNRHLTPRLRVFVDFVCERLFKTA